MGSLTFTTSISELKRIGVRRAKVLSENHIQTVQDLLYTFPRRHLDRTSVSQIKSLRKGDHSSIIGSVRSMGEKAIRRGRIFQVFLSDGTGSMTLTWFNGVKYIKNLFKVGDRLAVYGKIDYYNGFSITHPDFDRLSSHDDPVNTGAILPLYPLTQVYKSAGLEQRIFRKIMLDIFENLDEVPELFTQEICEKSGLIPRKDALHEIHFPKNEDSLKDAIYRLKFEEHFFLQLLMAFRKATLKISKATPFLITGPYVKLIEDSLPFELTKLFEGAADYVGYARKAPDRQLSDVKDVEKALGKSEDILGTIPTAAEMQAELDAIKEDSEEALKEIKTDGIKDQMTSTEPPKELKEPDA